MENGKKCGSDSMKRIDAVLKRLKEICPKSGMDAMALAKSMDLSRANVSSDLNKLCKMGLVKKSSSRPVLFTPKDDARCGENLTTLDKLLKENKSLTTAVEQAKAAILYPPRGMDTLILGETGTGKTMFAGIMHKYAIEMNRMDEDSPFIAFNCADYSNNPQLLLAHLFGVKKGAYTGAETDKPGLIERAEGGILFLDEVHRLPAEGQEMFFTFMDKGTFRRLGETGSERRANVLIIAATTENPDSSLLKTFTRRIPMIIRMPNLNERTIEERFNLITNFFREESFRLDREILVSVNSMRAFLSYNCPNNIGQLKTDIQLSCAKAYADFLSHKKDSITINSSELPNYIREGLYKEVDHRRIWNKLIGINSRYCVFNKVQQIQYFEKDDEQENIYEMIDFRINELKNKGVKESELGRIMEQDIENYFTRYLYGVNNKFDKSNLINVVEPAVIDLVEKIVRHSEDKLNKVLSQSVYLGMAIHIQSAIERVKKNKKILNPQLQTIRIEHAKEFNVALECLHMIESAFDMSMPIDEAGFLTIFFVLDDDKLKNNMGSVGVVVIAHGNSTAESMAEFANSLLGTNLAIGINMPLTEKPDEVLTSIRKHVSKYKRDAGYIFLVDMGSLTTFGEIIEKEFKVPVKVASLVSTIHVIEATRKAILGCSLDEIYKSVSEINAFESKDTDPEMNVSSKYAIVTMCTTGEGSAVAIKNFLRSHLKFDERFFEIISMQLSKKDDIISRLNRIKGDRGILCIISPFKIDCSILQFKLDEVLNLTAIRQIQNTIDVENTYIKMGETLRNLLKNVDSQMVFDDIKKCISKMEEKLKLKIDTDTIIGIALHISCMIDRLIDRETIVEYPDKENYISKERYLYEIVKDIMASIALKYSIDITDDEICYIMDFFNSKHMFSIA